MALNSWEIAALIYLREVVPLETVDELAVAALRAAEEATR